MHVITRRTLVAFWTEHPDAKTALENWFQITENANWKNSSQIKRHYSYASIISNERVAFNICGNKYRLIARINYLSGTVFIRFIGTHKEYEHIDAETI